MNGDRNFDDLAERFENKIYGSQKGQLRRAVIQRDLAPVIQRYKQSPSTQVLDLGGGLGHFAVELAQSFDVTYNDVSSAMMQKARQLALDKGVADNINWTCKPYQQFFEQHQKSYDIILCHAVLEWLQSPQQLIQQLAKALSIDGTLSLCFYNPAGQTMRNLVMGNFKQLDRASDTSLNRNSLTPINPSSIEQVSQWLTDAGLIIHRTSGIRVFSDYVFEKRGGLAYSEQVEQRELEYSNKEPYWRMGRYIHWLVGHHSGDPT